MLDKNWSAVTDQTEIREYVPGPPLASDSLTEHADHYKTDKGTIKHNYTPTYASYFRHARCQPLRLLEIGVGNGCSLKMWHDWTQWDITGMDKRPECANLCKDFDRITIAIGDATKDRLPGPFDIIIDDGSHQSSDMAQTLELNWQNLAPGGFYCIEDFRPTYKHRGPIRGMVDRIMQEVDLKRADYVHYYPELMIIKKSPQKQTNG